MTDRIDRSRMKIRKKGFQFPSLRPGPDPGFPLAEVGLDSSMNVLVFERGGLHRAMLLHDIAYHHLVQGDLAGEPYLVSF